MSVFEMIPGQSGLIGSQRFINGPKGCLPIPALKVGLSFLREGPLGKWRLDGIGGYYLFLYAAVLVTRRKLAKVRCLL